MAGRCERPVRSRGAAPHRGGGGRSGQAAAPVTVLPDLVIRYVSCVPLQKWKVRVTGAPSLTSAKNSGFSMMVLAV